VSDTALRRLAIAVQGYTPRNLKSERKDRALVVRALRLEPRVRRSGALDDAFDRALDRLRRTIGLERVVR
jgi:uncharacterized protein YcaQ